MCFYEEKTSYKKTTLRLFVFVVPKGGLAVGGNRLHRRASEDGCQPHAHGGLQVELACIKQRVPQR